MEQQNISKAKWNDEISIKVPAWSLYVLLFLTYFNGATNFAIGILFLWLISTGQINPVIKWDRAAWKKFWMIVSSILAIFFVIMLWLTLRNEVLTAELVQLIGNFFKR